MHGTEVSLQGIEQGVTETARALFSLLVAKCEGIRDCTALSQGQWLGGMETSEDGRSGNRLAAMLRGIVNDGEILVGEVRALIMPRLGVRTFCVPFLPSRRRTILRCGVGSRIIVSLRVFMVSQALVEGQFR